MLFSAAEPMAASPALARRSSPGSSTLRLMGKGLVGARRCHLGGVGHGGHRPRVVLAGQAARGRKAEGDGGENPALLTRRVLWGPNLDGGR
eukprot:7018234-Alexandrium_andersonii.AAC.1